MNNIIIYNSKLNLNKSKISNNFYKYDQDINNLYDCRVINPPFFYNIVILREDLNNDDLKKIYNMCLVNGKIYFKSKYKNFFNTNKLFITKKENIIYQFDYKRIVDFIIIGAQRSGTTSLSINLGKHPEIFINTNKDPKISEVHFYDLNWKKGIEWYKKQFNYNYKLVGEKTPSLINLPSTFPLIQSVNPYVKLILILRNPIIRAYSAWKLNKKNYNEKRSFIDAINYELKYKTKSPNTFFSISKKYLQRGMYYNYIIELYKWFPKNNILILIMEDLSKFPQQGYYKIFDFLNISQKNNLDYTVEHKSDDLSEIDKNIYIKLKKFYKNDVKNLEKLLNKKISWLN